MLVLVVATIGFLRSQSSLTSEFGALQSKFLPEKRSDTGYLRQLVKIADKYVVSSPDSVTLLLSEIDRYAGKPLSALLQIDVIRLQGEVQLSFRDNKKAIDYFEKALQLSQQQKGAGKHEMTLLGELGIAYMELGAFAEALNYLFDGLKLAEKYGDDSRTLVLYNNIANAFYYQNKYEDALPYYVKGLALAVQLGDLLSVAIANNNIGGIYLKKKQFHLALQYLKKVMDSPTSRQYPELVFSAYTDMANAYAALDSLALAAYYYEKVLYEAGKQGDSLYIAHGQLGMAKLLSKQGNSKSALLYAKLGLQAAKAGGRKTVIRDANEILSGIYANLGNGMEAYQHHVLFKQYADSLNNLESERATALLEAEYNYSQKELEFERTSLQQKWIIFSSLTGVLSMAIVLFLLVRNRNRVKQANNQLTQQKIEIEKQHSALEQTLHDLRVTQQQLIQSEKMASLGELTAGIAHEIQNPLNFVNNFSEVSNELIEEMLVELNGGEIEEAKAISMDIKQNLEKIAHHGKRADAIVKGMLHHSRHGTGKKESVKINALCDEYLRLAYHGLKAKDRSFNARFETHFDTSIGEIQVIPQEIGRVVLNLINNAFYAVNERKKLSEEGYEPQVVVSTTNEDGNVSIVVSDNGTGIPEKVIEKIFQPFFTTKPSGQGTGLGLSLSYDIVKAHGGELKVETREGSGTSFYIKLPLA